VPEVRTGGPKWPVRRPRRRIRREATSVKLESVARVFACRSVKGIESFFSLGTVQTEWVSVWLAEGHAVTSGPVCPWVPAVMAREWGDETSDQLKLWRQRLGWTCDLKYAVCLQAVGVSSAIVVSTALSY
jgi:hypothetical protein